MYVHIYNAYHYPIIKLRMHSQSVEHQLKSCIDEAKSKFSIKITINSLDLVMHQCVGKLCQDCSDIACHLNGAKPLCKPTLIFL